MGDIAIGQSGIPQGTSRPGIVPPWLGDDISIQPVPTPEESWADLLADVFGPLLDALTGARR